MGGPSVTSEVMDEVEHNVKTTDDEAWKPGDPTFRGFAEKVWMASSPHTRFTEIVAGILQRPNGRGGAATARRCSSLRNSLPNHI